VPKHLAHDDHASDVVDFFKKKKLKHLRARRRADLVVVESGPTKDPVAHVRFRRVAVSIWTLECATHMGRWQPTGFRGQLEQLLDVVTTALPWTIEKIV
jgi:hypothetical protein